jgi:hypothetical protein
MRISPAFAAAPRGCKAVAATSAVVLATGCRTAAPPPRPRPRPWPRPDVPARLAGTAAPHLQPAGHALPHPVHPRRRPRRRRTARLAGPRPSSATRSARAASGCRPPPCAPCPRSPSAALSRLPANRRRQGTRASAQVVTIRRSGYLRGGPSPRSSAGEEVSAGPRSSPGGGPPAVLRARSRPGPRECKPSSRPSSCPSGPPTPAGGPETN